VITIEAETAISNLVQYYVFKGHIQVAEKPVDMPETAYCAICEEEQEIVKTVSWQSDTCAVCGNDIETIPL
jgi:hypothetical protein